MKIELLNRAEVSEDTPSVTLDRSLLESIKGLRINGVEVFFTDANGEPQKEVINYAISEKGEDGSPGQLVMTARDLVEMECSVQDLVDAGMTKSVYYAIRSGKTITRRSKERTEKAISEVAGMKVTLNVPTHSY
jgi:hypothetical protein